MMPTQVKKLPLYSKTRDALVTSLALAEYAFSDAEFSYDPKSDYRRALAAIDATLLQLRALAVNTLKEIDDAISESQLVADLLKEAKNAKSEAEALNRAAHTIEDIAQVITKITGVVTSITGLPFL